MTRENRIEVHGRLTRLCALTISRTRGFLALGSEDKTYRVFGREHGDPTDFGHGDLVIGDHAPTVIFPEIAAWLRTHDVAEAGEPVTEVAA